MEKLQHPCVEFNEIDIPFRPIQESEGRNRPRYIAMCVYEDGTESEVAKKQISIVSKVYDAKGLLGGEYIKSYEHDIAPVLFKGIKPMYSKKNTLFAATSIINCGMREALLEDEDFAKFVLRELIGGLIEFTGGDYKRVVFAVTDCIMGDDPDSEFNAKIRPRLEKLGANIIDGSNLAYRKASLAATEQGNYIAVFSTDSILNGDFA